MALLATDVGHMSLSELPEDVQQSVCQHLFHASDLARLAVCSRACRSMVSRPTLWRGLLFTRFGRDVLRDNSSFDSAALRALYIRKSRTTVPALEIGGVMPGDYQIIWRTMKVTRGHIGLTNSAVMADVVTHKVHPSTDERENPGTCHLQLDMQQFNELPTGHWVDVPLGTLHVDHFTNVSSRFWCHSGDWKHGLAWDSVALKDVSQHEQHQHHATSSAASAVAPVVQAGRQAADAACVVQ